MTAYRLARKENAKEERVPEGRAEVHTKKLEFANLDVLRSVAVLLVMALHTLLCFGTEKLGGISLRPMGTFGVLLFFVHTSLVLMLSLQRQQRQPRGGGLFVPFMVRRVFRIYPLSVLTVTCIFLFQVPVTNFAWPDIGWGGYMANMLLVQNLTGSASIPGVLWSLPYEIQMYLLLPALFLLANRLRSMWPLLVLWAGAALVAGLNARHPVIPDLVKYVPCFLPGIMAFKLGLHRSRLRFHWWPVFLGMVTVFFVFFGHIAAGWVACLAVGLAIPYFQEMPDGLLRKCAHLVAKYSYGIYLVHTSCLWLAFRKCDFLPMAGRMGLFLILVILLPVVLYHAVESPLIEVGRKLTSGRSRPRVASPMICETAPVSRSLTGQDL